MLASRRGWQCAAIRDASIASYKRFAQRRRSSIRHSVFFSIDQWLFSAGMWHKVATATALHFNIESGHCCSPAQSHYEQSEGERESSMAASKVKDTVEELQAQIRKLAERFDKEREKQISQLEKQLEKVRDRLNQEMKRQREYFAKVEKLQAEYRDRATATVKKQIERARKAAEDARKQVEASQGRKRILETEVRVLKATAKQAHSLSRVIGQYEKDLEKRAKEIERKVAPKKAAAKKAPAKKKAAAKKAATKKKAVAKRAPAKKKAAAPSSGN